MSEISRANLFSKLDSLAYKAIEGATVFCKLRGNPYVELVHWIQQILQTPDSDIHRIVRHFEIDASRLAKDVVDSLDRLPRGATSISDLSSHVEKRGGAWMGVRDADVRRASRAHRAPRRRHAEDAVAPQCADRDFASVRSDQARRPDRRLRAHREGLAGREDDGRRRVGGAGRGEQRHAAGAAGQAGGAADDSRPTSPSGPEKARSIR